jgi:hypothetical protein
MLFAKIDNHYFQFNLKKGKQKPAGSKALFLANLIQICSRCLSGLKSIYGKCLATHSFFMLQFLTDGHWDEEKDLYFTANGLPRYYFCSGNLRSEPFRGITPPNLIDIIMLHDCHDDGALQEGVMFHLIEA